MAQAYTKKNRVEAQDLNRYATQRTPRNTKDSTQKVIILNKQEALKLIIYTEDMFYRVDNKIQEFINKGLSRSRLQDIFKLLDKAALSIDEANDLWEKKSYVLMQKKITEAQQDLNLVISKLSNIRIKKGK